METSFVPPYFGLTADDVDAAVGPSMEDLVAAVAP